MWIGLLGSLQVRVDGAAVAVPAARQRALLAVLAVRAGELVPTDELAEIVWDGKPPDQAAATVRNYVKRLRFRLGSGGRQIVTCRPGYRLEVAEDELDLRLFTRLCRDGGAAVRGGDWAVAFGGLGQALGLWRGAPFADAGCERLARERSRRFLNCSCRRRSGAPRLAWRWAGTRSWWVSWPGGRCGAAAGAVRRAEDAGLVP